MDTVRFNAAWVAGCTMRKAYGLRRALADNPFQFGHRNYYRYLLGVSDYGQK